MTPPTKADDPPAADAHARDNASTPRRLTSIPRKARTPLVFLLLFAFVFLLHLSLLHLPYYWDEAGYFIPAARDIYTDGSFIPHSTLSNAHPPLVMSYLALAWKLFGFQIEVTRVAMLLVSALALTGLFRLAERVSNARVAAATVITTALYPVFFAQSSLAHLDMTAAALTTWGLVLYLPGADVIDERHGLRRAMSVAVFALAGLADAAALHLPSVLFAWELLCLLVRGKERFAAVVCVGRTRSV